jgi:hypothetical protein
VRIGGVCGTSFGTGFSRVHDCARFCAAGRSLIDCQLQASVSRRALLFRRAHPDSYSARRPRGRDDRVQLHLAGQCG